MKKMYVNRAVVEGPYGGGNNFVKALYENASEHGYIATNNLTSDIDAIFMIDPRYDEHGVSINEIASYKTANPATKVFYRINECDKRKGENQVIDPVIKASSKFCDVCFFISDWIMDYHVDKGWQCSNNSVIYSGTNKQHFAPRRKIDNGKINIVTHHWSDNRLKGQDVYEAIDDWISSRGDKYTFTYIGRTKSKFSNSKIVSPTFGQDLGNALSKFDVYVSGSRFDPGPNHIIESLACKIPTYAHKDSGGAVEMVGSDHVYNSVDHILDILGSENFPSNNGLVPKDWSKCISQYFEIINSVS